jgi:glucose-6-phosphate 1-dehydrogenase
MSGLAQVVIFGASGDLSARKLVPALVGNVVAGTLDRRLQVVGVSRRPKTSEAWREELETWLPPDHRDAWRELSSAFVYQRGDLGSGDDMAALRDRLDGLAREAGHDPARTGRVFYLSLRPQLFEPAVRMLDEAGMLTCDEDDGDGFRRVVVEKPFGRDLASARALNRALRTHLREDQIWRIDHYLGKETVQNILVFRFQNAIFEPLWNRQHVESVEISVCETVGVEGGRGAYYDQAGALRDMVQNHLLQVLSLVAMEAPTALRSGPIRDEKVKVLSALQRMTPERVAADVVRARYTSGPGRTVGYLKEAGVAADSMTETYVALRTQVHNWRWNGVPFLLRTGKCLHKRYTEVILRFRTPPIDLVTGPIDAEICALRPNALRILLQPNEGLRLDFLVKKPGPGTIMRPSTLGFDYADLEEQTSPPAYQRLLHDVVEGDSTLFLRADETEAAWEFADAIRAGWNAPGAPPMHTYQAGSAGPEIADELFRGCEGVWGDGDEL